VPRVQAAQGHVRQTWGGGDVVARGE
jgi:hypothetical protein